MLSTLTGVRFQVLPVCDRPYLPILTKAFCFCFGFTAFFGNPISFHHEIRKYRYPPAGPPVGGYAHSRGDRGRGAEFSPRCISGENTAPLLNFYGYTLIAIKKDAVLSDKLPKMELKTPFYCPINGHLFPISQKSDFSPTFPVGFFCTTNSPQKV